MCDLCYIADPISGSAFSMRERKFTDIWFAHWDARRFSLATDSGFDWLAEAKRLMPKKYGKKNKGHEFYFLGISAFRAHDYQTATFLFDAALSEDLDRNRSSRGSPTLAGSPIPMKGRGRDQRG